MSPGMILSPLKGSAQIYWKRLKSPPRSHFYSCSCTKGHQMVWRLRARGLVLNPSPQWTEIVQISWKRLILNTPTHKLYTCIVLLLVKRGIKWHVGKKAGVDPHPSNRKCPNILKTVEISTYRTYIFLILGSCRFIWFIVKTTREHLEFPK